MKKFTFKQAKEKISELEQKIVELKDAAVKDIKDDTKKIGVGDILFFAAGIVVGLLICKIF